MKRLHSIFISFIIIFFVLGGIHCNAQDGGNLPDGMEILKEKMDRQEIPVVDFSKIKFEFPETMPDELSFIKGYSDKDHLTVKAPNGFEAHMTKMGTISPPM